MYQQCYQRWNSCPVEEDVAHMTPNSIALRALGHESVNVVKSGKLKGGRCSECSTGVHKKPEWRLSTAAYIAMLGCVVTNAMTFITVG